MCPFYVRDAVGSTTCKPSFCNQSFCSRAVCSLRTFRPSLLVEVGVHMVLVAQACAYSVAHNTRLLALCVYSSSWRRTAATGLTTSLPNGPPSRGAWDAACWWALRWLLLGLWLPPARRRLTRVIGECASSLCEKSLPPHIMVSSKTVSWRWQGCRKASSAMPAPTLPS